MPKQIQTTATTEAPKARAKRSRRAKPAAAPVVEPTVVEPTVAEQAVRTEQAEQAAAAVDVQAILQAEPEHIGHAVTPESERLAPLTDTAPALIVSETTETDSTETESEKPRNVHYHRERGVSAAHYAGLSSYFNDNRKTAIPIGNTKYHVKAADLTKRGLGLRKALSDAYGSDSFPARGLDNSILARLISCGFVSTVSGGAFGYRDGTRYQFDGAEPLYLGLTDAALAYGKANA